jgi:hypothetical protein
MTKDEALRLALEALEKTQSSLAQCFGSHKSEEGDRHRALAYSRTTISAIKAALEAKDEPVAWVYSEFWQHLENLNCGTAYRLPGIGRQPLYTTQPQRKPLTDDEIWKFWWARPAVPDGEDDSMEAQFVAAVRAIEATHGIKENI